MSRVLVSCGAAAMFSACSPVNRAPTACDVLSADEIASALQASSVRKDKSSGLNDATGVDTCRWTLDDRTGLELRLYRADSSAESAWALVFESAKVHATTPDAAGQVRGHGITGVGDDAMFLPGSSGEGSVAFRIGRTGATLAGKASEAVLVDLAKRVAGRL